MDRLQDIDDTLGMSLKKLTDHQVVATYHQLASRVESIVREAGNVEVHVVLGMSSYQAARSLEKACYAEVKRRGLVVR